MDLCGEMSDPDDHKGMLSSYFGARDATFVMSPILRSMMNSAKNNIRAFRATNNKQAPPATPPSETTALFQQHNKRNFKFTSQDHMFSISNILIVLDRGLTGARATFPEPHPPHHLWWKLANRPKISHYKYLTGLMSRLLEWMRVQTSNSGTFLGSNHHGYLCRIDHETRECWCPCFQSSICSNF